MWGGRSGGSPGSAVEGGCLWVCLGRCSVLDIAHRHRLWSARGSISRILARNGGARGSGLDDESVAAVVSQTGVLRNCVGVVPWGLDWISTGCRPWWSPVAGPKFARVDLGPKHGAPGSASGDFVFLWLRGRPRSRFSRSRHDPAARIGSSNIGPISKFGWNVQIRRLRAPLFGPSSGWSTLGPAMDKPRNRHPAEGYPQASPKESRNSRGMSTHRPGEFGPGSAKFGATVRRSGCPRGPPHP